ncbi:dephospho-CoA kinase-like [Wolffia australiana]
MRIVGLTGGIASGKSTVSRLFSSNGVPIVDADLIARDVLRKGTRGWREVVRAFGEEILQPHGEIDRLLLGRIVFSDPDKRRVLNRLLAPHISFGIAWEVAKLWLRGHDVIVLDIPLLFEAGLDRWTRPIIAVWVDPKTQLQRLVKRDGCDEEQARARINAQAPLDWKRERADVVIDNSGPLEDTRRRFEEVLAVVARPLTLTEFLRSRNGLTLTLALTAAVAALAYSLL